PALQADEKSGYEVVKIAAGANLFQKVNELVQNGKNAIAVADPSYASNFTRLGFLKRNMFKMDHNVIVLLAANTPQTFSISASHEVTEQRLSNVVGILPGKSKKDEYVIFSGHY